MTAEPRRITLLTDFGTADGYVAAMKGVIAGIAPLAVVEDATHDIPPGDIGAGAWALGAYWRVYPPGTVHMAVVDPGVGSARRALAVRIEGRIFVAPDNGLLSPVLRGGDAAACVELTNRRLMRDVVSATFHGRDIFAPVAAHLAAGVPLHELGPAAADPVLLDEPEPMPTAEGIEGRVVHIDRFGNLITNLPSVHARGAMRVRVRTVELAVHDSYTAVAVHALLAVHGSRGMIEIAKRDGNAAAALDVGRGTPVLLLPAR